MNKEEAQKLQEKFDGSTYSLPTKILPEEMRAKILTLYKFVRIFDEYIDEEKTPNIQKFSSAKEEYKKALTQGSSIDFIDKMADLAKIENIEDQIDIFLKSMEVDITKSRYENYQELEEYMLGSATAIAYIFIRFCKGDENLRPEAKSLAEFSQMVNFLRDVKEDILERNRIYIPLEDMRKFEVTESDIQDQKYTMNFVNLIKYESKRCEELYKHGLSGISKLPKNVRLGVYASAFAYKKYLEKIQKLKYNVFSYKKLKLNKFEKISTLLKAFFYTYL